jgi:hypothetical protein
LLYKNLAQKNKFVILFFRLVLDGINAAGYLAQGKFYGPWVVLKAHFHFYSHLKNLKSSQAIHFPETLNKKSILWQYFVKNKKKFSDL